MSWLAQLVRKGSSLESGEAPTWFPTGIDVQNQFSHKVQVKCTFIFRLGWGKKGQSLLCGRGHV